MDASPVYAHIDCVLVGPRELLYRYCRPRHPILYFCASNLDEADKTEGKNGCSKEAKNEGKSEGIADSGHIGVAKGRSKAVLVERELGGRSL